MDYLIAVTAGAIQGITEFLPISSTAHLIIFEKLFNLPANKFGLGFDASIHLGTLLAVIIFFAKDYLEIFNTKNKLYLKLLVGTLPAVVLGLLLENAIGNQFRNLGLIGIALIGFSAVMYFAERVGKKNTEDKRMSTINSLIIGIAQSLALIPGISRSGATISAGLFVGQTRANAAKFAFMLSGPIIAGAGLKKLSEVVNSDASVNISVTVVGIISSFIFGYLTIKYFLKYLSSKTLNPFIFYRITLGVLLILLQTVLH